MPHQLNKVRLYLQWVNPIKNNIKPLCEGRNHRQVVSTFQCLVMKPDEVVTKVLQFYRLTLRSKCLQAMLSISFQLRQLKNSSEIFCCFETTLFKMISFFPLFPRVLGLRSREPRNSIDLALNNIIDYSCIYTSVAFRSSHCKTHNI